ncbi:MAG TPA: response regulator, partial [Blastocatellia bacterium]|nr:response regulator [Blastocatellia bacterium]
GLAPRVLGPGFLVVDDRWENRALLVKLLRTVGFEVREAANGREAVDEWDAWRPALIWMDMRMPVMDGRAATREIRRREGSGDRCKILALTASAFEHERGAVLAAGCDDFVTKPYREATIFEKLESFLGTRFVYDEPDASGPATSEALLTPERLVRVPAELIEELQAALVLGNVKDAQFVVDNIAQVDQGLADDLRRLVRSYQFDEILDTIEACGIR